MEEAITELKSLMRGKHVGNNSPGNLKIAGSLADRLVKTSTYGKDGKSAVGLEIETIKKAISDFAKQVKNEKNWKENQYREMKKEIIEK